jgi:hypothetical protein
VSNADLFRLADRVDQIGEDLAAVAGEIRALIEPEAPPCEPCIPCAPCAPSEPCVPCAPCEPCTPCEPIEPPPPVEQPVWRQESFIPCPRDPWVPWFGHSSRRLEGVLYVDDAIELTADVEYPEILVAPDGVLVVGEGCRHIRTHTVQVAPGGVFTDAVGHPGFTLEFLDQPIDRARDPGMHGGGLICCGDIDLGGDFVLPRSRLRAEVSAGATSVPIGAHDGWRVGDLVAIPGSMMSRERTTELRIIESLENDEIGFSIPLNHDHPGGYSVTGEQIALPYCVNMSRRIRFESENPSGNRTHAMFTGYGRVDLRGVGFYKMGRTTRRMGRVGMTTYDEQGTAVTLAENEQYRNPLNIRGLYGVEDTPSWSITNAVVLGGPMTEHDAIHGAVIHDSHYGRLDVTVGCMWGGGIVNSAGNETANDISGTCFMIFGDGDLEDKGTATGGAGVWAPTGFNRYTDLFIAECDIGITLFQQGRRTHEFPRLRSEEMFIPIGPGRPPEEFVPDRHKLPMPTILSPEICAVHRVGNLWEVDGGGDIADLLAWNLRRDATGIFGYGSANLALHRPSLYGDGKAIAVGRDAFYEGTGIVESRNGENFRIIEPVVEGFSVGIRVTSNTRETPFLIAYATLANRNDIALGELKRGPNPRYINIIEPVFLDVPGRKWRIYVVKGGKGTTDGLTKVLIEIDGVMYRYYPLEAEGAPVWGEVVPEGAIEMDDIDGWLAPTEDAP